jgi:hypothetical protein
VGWANANEKARFAQDALAPSSGMRPEGPGLLGSGDEFLMTFD